MSQQKRRSIFPKTFLTNKTKRDLAKVGESCDLLTQINSPFLEKESSDLSEIEKNSEYYEVIKSYLEKGGTIKKYKLVVQDIDLEQNVADEKDIKDIKNFKLEFQKLE
tara:strand:- start:399 stop:722 length:324 start_codon:yes stop_codon:yes gene_type:complete